MHVQPKTLLGGWSGGGVGGLGAGVSSNSQGCWQSFSQMNFLMQHFCYDVSDFSFFFFRFYFNFSVLLLLLETHLVFGAIMRLWQKILLTALHSSKTGGEKYA